MKAAGGYFGANSSLGLCASSDAHHMQNSTTDVNSRVKSQVIWSLGVFGTLGFAHDAGRAVMSIQEPYRAY